MFKKPNKVNIFWLSYRDAVVSSGIAEKNAEWNISWAQKFAVSIKGKGLRSRSRTRREPMKKRSIHGEYVSILKRLATP